MDSLFRQLVLPSICVSSAAKETWNDFPNRLSWFFLFIHFFLSILGSRARTAPMTPCFHPSARPPRLGRPVPCPPSRQFTQMINHLSLQGRFPLRSIHPVKLCTPHNNGICSYRRSAERTRTHICSRIPQTINNSLLPFKSHFSDKVSTIRKNKLRLEKRGGGGGEEVGVVLAILDGGKSFSQSFFRGEQIPLSSPLSHAAS